MRGLGSRLEEVKEGQRDGKTRRAESWSQGTECSQKEGTFGPSNTAEGQVREEPGELTTGLGSRKIIGDLDKSVPSSHGLHGRREEAVETVRSVKGHQRKQQNGPGWRRASETQDAKCAASGLSKGPSTFYSALTGPQCGGPGLHHLRAPKP